MRSFPMTVLYRRVLECFCGKSKPTKKSDNCDMACTGSPGVICGGSDAVTVFKRDGGSGGGAKPIACYRDYGKSRIMALAFLESDSMTPQVTQITWIFVDH